MFRQKMADVTNCQCRLIPDQSNEYMIFKTQNSNAKPLNKEPKQKYSLKTQTASSNKHENKVTSSQKTSLKVAKPYEDQKISISGNLQPKIQKIQKNFFCSPENSQVKYIDQNLILFSKPGFNIRNVTTMQNSVKTTQNNKIRQQQNTNMNSHNNQYLRNQQNKDIFVSNFSNQKSINSRETHQKTSEIPKKSLNFDQYYKCVSNPYAVNEKNKQNVCFGGNSQISRYKIDLKVKKQHRKLRDQVLPLQQIMNNFQPQITHQSLQKYQSSKEYIRETQKTKNSTSSQSDSMKMSKNPISLLNSKIVNFQQNPSLQFNKFNDQCQFDEFRTNQSEVYTQRNYEVHVNEVSRNNHSENLLTQIQTHRMNYDNGFAPKGTNTRQFLQIQRAYGTLEHSKVDNFNDPLVNSAHNRPILPQGLNSKVKKQSKCQKMIIQKINTFTDFINNTAECESLVGESDLSYNQNQQSVVILRYKDLVQQIQGLNQFEPVLLKSENLQVGSKHDKKNEDNNLMDHMKMLTSTKQVAGKMNSFPSYNNSTIFNQNMKKTVKVNKGYSTNGFNTLQ